MVTHGPWAAPNAQMSAADEALTRPASPPPSTVAGSGPLLQVRPLKWCAVSRLLLSL